MNIYKDGASVLAPIMTRLFNCIAVKQKIPDVWRMAKVIPTHKKGPKNKLENYRPISNLCAISKIYEKQILLYIGDLEKRAKIRLCGNSQHGFQKNRSTNSCLLNLQLKIAKAMDDNKYCGVYSLDLTAAFDVLQPKLVNARLKQRGFPDQLVTLIYDFMENRTQFIQIGAETSYIQDVPAGCVQGSVLGPVIFALCMSPLEEMISSEIVSYADDSYNSVVEDSKESMVEKLPEMLRKHVMWLRNSGMIVNDSKTELIIFSKDNNESLSISVGETVLKSQKSIKALGVVIDNKMKWGNHIESTLKACKKSLNALKIIRNHFTESEFKILCTSLIYSRLYYCCEIWLTPALSQRQYNRIMTLHNNVTRLIIKDFNKEIPSDKLSSLSKRATPKEWSNFVHAKLLYLLLSNHEPSCLLSEIIPLIYFERRYPNRPKIILNQRKKQSINLPNRLHFIANSINFDWFDNGTSFAAFKSMTKKLYFSYLHNIKN